MESDLMNCRGVRKFLYAFADDQLGVKANCEVLDHLKMCPACSRLVEEHQTLRRAIGRTLAEVQVPHSLHSRVAGALSPAAASPSRRTFAWTLQAPRHRATAIAAALLLLVGATWIGASLLRKAPPPAVSPVVVEGGQIAASLVADIHVSHASLGPAHHRSDLPSTLAEVGPAISRHFEDRLAVAVPDLSSYGYVFESANFCGVRKADCTEGGHVIYASTEDQTRLSFFVVPRFDRFDHCNGQRSVEPEAYREYEVDQASGVSLSVLAWHRDETTFVCVGSVDINRMKAMVGAVRTAMGDFDERLKVACAMLRRMLPHAAPAHTHSEPSCSTPCSMQDRRGGFVDATDARVGA